MPPGAGYYGGAPNAFAGGMVFSKDMRRRVLQENALKSLIGRYGDAAADPESLATLQSVEQREQLFPHQLGAAERATAGAEANVEQFGAQAGDPEAATLEARKNEQRRAILHRAVSALKMVRDKKGDMPGALQQFGQILSHIGMPPEELTELQENLITNPDSLDELDAMLRGTGAEGVRAVGAPVPVYDDQGQPRLMQYLNDGSTRIIEGVRPAATVQGEMRLQQSADRLNQGWNRLSFDQAKARGFDAPPDHQIWETPEGEIVATPILGSKAEREIAAEYAETLEAARAKIRVFTGISEANQTVVRHGGRALARMDDGWIQRHNILSAVARSAASRVPGTELYEMERDIQSVKDNIGINELLRIKESGSGLGQVPQQQLITLQSVLGRLEISRDPASLREDLENVLRIFGDVMNRADAEVRDAEQQLNAPPPTRRTPPAPGNTPDRGEPPGPNATPEEILRYYAPPDGD